jgi:hypothetical protein
MAALLVLSSIWQQVETRLLLVRVGRAK